MELVTRVQILDKAVCILHLIDALGKDMNPSVLPPVMGKIVRQTGFFSLG